MQLTFIQSTLSPSLQLMSAEQLALLAPSDSLRLEFQQALLHFIQGVVDDQKAGFDLKLIRDLSFISELAYYKEGLQGNAIEAIEPLESLFYVLHFEYEWRVFQGCMGLNETGTLKDKVRFKLSQNENNDWLLDFDLTAFGKLSTADEL